MQTILIDLRYAVRKLRKSPDFTITVLLTLAVGIGATTAIFTLICDALLKPLPYSPSREREHTQAGIRLWPQMNS